VRKITWEHVKLAVFWLLNLCVALIFLLAMAVGIGVNRQWYVPVMQPAYADTAFESGIVHIGRELFTTYVVPFEVLSLLLLSALVGAIYLAKRDVGGDLQ